MINWYRALLRVRPPLLPDPIVRPPTTIIWGKQDRFLRHEMAAESIRLCSQGRLLYFDDATHWVQHEEPDRVNAVLIG